MVPFRPAGPHVEAVQATFVAESIPDLATLAPGESSLLSPDGAPRDVVRAYYHPGWVSHGVIASTPTNIVRFLDGLFNGHLVSQSSLDQMMQLVEIEIPSAGSGTHPASRSGKPSYGLGVMRDPASPWGCLVGHNGGGPGYSASAFHTPDLRGASVCAMGAIEEDFAAEDLVAAILDRL